MFELELEKRRRKKYTEKKKERRYLEKKN